MKVGFNWGDGIYVGCLISQLLSVATINWEMLAQLIMGAVKIQMMLPNKFSLFRNKLNN